MRVTPVAPDAQPRNASACTPDIAARAQCGRVPLPCNSNALGRPWQLWTQVPSPFQRSRRSRSNRRSVDPRSSRNPQALEERNRHLLRRKSFGCRLHFCHPLNEPGPVGRVISPRSLQRRQESFHDVVSQANLSAGCKAGGRHRCSDQSFHIKLHLHVLAKAIEIEVHVEHRRPVLDVPEVGLNEAPQFHASRPKDPPNPGVVSTRSARPDDVHVQPPGARAMRTSRVSTTDSDLPSLVKNSSLAPSVEGMLLVPASVKDTCRAVAPVGFKTAA